MIYSIIACLINPERMNTICVSYLFEQRRLQSVDSVINEQAVVVQDCE